MTLKEYMNAKGLSDQDVADGIGLHRVSVTRYRNGVIVPSWAVIDLIKKFTRGAVTETDWAAVARRRATA